MAPSPDRRPGFSRRAQYGLFLSYILAIAGAVVGVVLLALSNFNPPLFAAVRSTATELTTPVSTVLAAGVRGIVAVPTTIGSYFRVHGENAALRGEIARQRALVMQARTIVRDNRRLRGLLRLRDGDDTPVVTARIVSTTASSTRRFGILNAGQWQGVRVGYPVRGPDGLIGRVVEAGPNSARVLLVIDPESIVPVRRIGDGMPALAAGRGDGLVEIRSVQSANGRFRPGDLYVTSGTGGIFAPGTPVAKVIAAGADSAPAQPFAHADSFDFAEVGRAFMPPPPPPRPPAP